MLGIFVLFIGFINLIIIGVSVFYLLSLFGSSIKVRLMKVVLIPISCFYYGYLVLSLFSEESRDLSLLAGLLIIFGPICVFGILLLIVYIFFGD